MCTLLLKVLEADHDIRHLHASVVNVILNLDVVAAEAQHSDEGVAQHGVAQVADVRRLVGVNAGVLHQNLARMDGLGRGGEAAHLEERCGQRRAVKMEVHVTGPGNADAFHPFNGKQVHGQLLGNLTRRLPELFRQFKAGGD